MDSFTKFYGRFFVLTFVQNGTIYSWKPTLIECETFRSYFTCHGENLDKIFTLGDFPYKFSEINVLCELKVK